MSTRGVPVAFHDPDLIPVAFQKILARKLCSCTDEVILYRSCLRAAAERSPSSSRSATDPSVLFCVSIRENIQPVIYHEKGVVHNGEDEANF